MHSSVLNRLKYWGLDKNLGAILVGGVVFSLLISWAVEMLVKLLFGWG
ncbi:MAG: hypothetical protein HOP02_05135 [Methylococcaceae bacterium]|nr:hypothetical protein [Methylococcaceae bacterium]